MSGGGQGPVGLDLVTALTAWSDGVRRGMFHAPDRLLEAAVADRRIDRLLVANPYRSGPIRLARRLSGDGEAPLPTGPGLRVQLTPTRWRRRDPTSSSGVQRACRAFDRAVADQAARMGMHRPPVILWSPLVAAWAPLDWAGPVTYYAWDDWAVHPAFRPWHAEYPRAYERIRERGHRVVAVSRALLERLAPTAPSTIVPNGVSPAEWLAPGPPPDWFLALPRPRIVYAGMIDHRLDVDAVLEVARHQRAGSVVLVGPTDGATHLAPLDRVPNVVLPGPQGRSSVVGIISGADACIMPHRSDPLTQAMCPLKLYEYVAAGRPVAASGLPPVASVHDRIVTVPPGSSFAIAVETALAQGPLDEADRRAFVRASSWSARFDAILALATTEAPPAAGAGTPASGPFPQMA